MNSSEDAVLSVILMAPEGYELIRRTVQHLKKQTLCKQMEVVLAAPSARDLEVDRDDMADFLKWKVVEVGPIQVTGHAMAEGVRAASAPLVVFSEDHSFPEPEWAEALVNAQKAGWSVVGPAAKNANPETLVSWAAMLFEYGKWMHPAAGGEYEHLPGHNSCYRRDILLAYGERLEEMLNAETVLHWDLKSRGYRLYLEPKAITHHMNFSKVNVCLRCRLLAGRVFAGTRAQHWNTVHRLVYGVGSPLLPILFLWRMLKELFKPGRPRHLFPRILPLLLAVAAASALGEMAGYLSGVGKSLVSLTEMEYARERYNR